MSTYFHLTHKTFLQDKKLFVLDWSLSTLKASTTEIKFEIKSRLDELQLILPRLFNSPPGTGVDDSEVFKGLADKMKNEILAVTFYQKVGEHFSGQRKHLNSTLLKRLGVTGQDILNISEADLKKLESSSKNSSGLWMMNRSVLLTKSNKSIQLPVLSLVLNGNRLGENNSENFVVVDVLQNFIQKALNQSELAQVFLVSKEGKLISHPDNQILIQFSNNQFSHPIVSRLNASNLPKESFEASFEGQDYLINFSPTGLGDVFTVSQIKKSDAFQALTTLTQQSMNMGLLILSLALIGSVIFSAQLTRNIKKLEIAAKTIGEGNFEVKTKIKSGDEVEKVANAFEWMTQKIVSLLKETAEKARMQEELATASLIQNTILTPPELSLEKTPVLPYYRSASECGGDLWDAFIKNGKLTVLLGDATGHGAPAAIVTAVVKSCVSTLNELKREETNSPAELLKCINQIVYQSCKGQLLMTMSVAQLDLETGKLTIANAGHEAPFRVSTPDLTQASSKRKTEALFVSGERLGFSPESRYSNLTLQLNPGEAVLVYSDGLTEALNPANEIWGERKVKKVFGSLSHLPLQELKNELLKNLEDFTQGTPQPDDITFVLFGWKKDLTDQVSTRKSAA